MIYKEHEIDLTKTNYSDGVAIMPLPDGSIVCIPEQDATADELGIISEIKADVENRIIEVVAPTEEVLRLQYEALTVQYIREQYSQDDENKVIREYLSDLTNETYKAAFDNYNTYVRACKLHAHGDVYGIE